MSIPKQFSRVTKNDRYQIYQPGFNSSNSCWLAGAWVTLPKQEWGKIKDEHEKLYSTLDTKNQSHHNGPTLLKDMSLAQKKAWEYFSCKNTFECYNENNKECVKFVAVNLAMSGRSISKKSLKWFKDEWLAKGFKIIRFVSSYGETSEQTKEFSIPEEILLDNKEPIDTVKLTIEQNEAYSYSMAESILDRYVKGSDDFITSMAIQILIDLEQEIIRSEWHKSKGKPDFYEDIKKSTERYVVLRKKAKEKLLDSFDSLYRQVKESHNSCERSNLDTSKGSLFCFVLPVFNDDGSHEPWGSKDVPWNADD